MFKKLKQARAENARLTAGLQAKRVEANLLQAERDILKEEIADDREHAREVIGRLQDTIAELTDEDGQPVNTPCRTCAHQETA